MRGGAHAGKAAGPRHTAAAGWHAPAKPSRSGAGQLGRSHPRGRRHRHGVTPAHPPTHPSSLLLLPSLQYNTILLQTIFFGLHLLASRQRLTRLQVGRAGAGSAVPGPRRVGSLGSSAGCCGAMPGGSILLVGVVVLWVQHPPIHPLARHLLPTQEGALLRFIFRHITLEEALE